jgi:hypothetical protein
MGHGDMSPTMTTRRSRSRIPPANGDTVLIDHLSVGSPSKTLGSMTCLSGSSNGALTQIWEKAQGWID